MPSHEHDHPHHEHTPHAEDGLGLLVGFRIFEDEGELYLAEAEISPYVDDSNALGVTMVFHPLTGIDPTTDEGDDDRQAFPFDFDDELTRAEDAPLAEQTQAILRQLSQIPEASLREYLRVAREEYNSGDE
ncbi:MAG TPA: hypothetical protein VF613_08810 [Longimicrobium sp.]|jgi:hypothetical protein